MKRLVTAERIRVCDEVREAFAGVRLEGGVGLMEARGLDDYADAKTLSQCRREDERDDWSAIPSRTLQQYCDTLSFFDSKGMRFHLPAFMIGELERKVDPGPLYHLINLDDWRKTKFVSLTQPQRQAVRAYLLLLRDDPDYRFDRVAIEAALADYWKG